MLDAHRGIILSADHGLVSFFVRYFWKRSSSWDGISVKKIQSVWPGISRVDAAYEYKRQHVFFEGNMLFNECVK